MFVCLYEASPLQDEKDATRVNQKALVINKLDLLPYVDYDVEKAKRQALAINPHLRIFELSCRTGEGLDAWCDWLLSFAQQKM